MAGAALANSEPGRLGSTVLAHHVSSKSGALHQPHTFASGCDIAFLDAVMAGDLLVAKH